MAQNPDGTASCDRCGVNLPGYGVIHGMICSDLNGAGEIIDRIFCYENKCRDAIVKAASAYLTKRTET